MCVCARVKKNKTINIMDVKLVKNNDIYIYIYIYIYILFILFICIYIYIIHFSDYITNLKMQKVPS